MRKQQKSFCLNLVLDLKMNRDNMSKTEINRKLSLIYDSIRNI